jgi:hypothetical protein
MTVPTHILVLSPCVICSLSRDQNGDVPESLATMTLSSRQCSLLRYGVMTSEQDSHYNLQSRNRRAVMPVLFHSALHEILLL